MTAPDAPATATAPALEFDDLDVAYRVRGIWRRVLRGVSFQHRAGRVLRAGRRVRLRQVDCRASRRALPAAQRPRGRRLGSGSADEDLLQMTTSTCASCEPTTVSMVYQNPGGALNPSIRIGDQVAEVYRSLGVAEDEATSGAPTCSARSRSPTPPA